MAEHNDATLFACQSLDIYSNSICYSAKTLAAAHFLIDLLAAGWLRAFRNDHNRELSSQRITLGDLFDCLLKEERNLWNKNDVGAACDACVERYPSDVAAHHFDKHHPFVALTGGVKPVYGFGGDVERGVESKSQVGADEVVVDRFWNPDHGHPHAEQFVADALRAFAADYDQRVETQSFDVKFGLLEGGFVLDDLAADIANVEAASIGCSTTPSWWSRTSSA